MSTIRSGSSRWSTIQQISLLVETRDLLNSIKHKLQPGTKVGSANGAAKNGSKAKGTASSASSNAGVRYVDEVLSKVKTALDGVLPVLERVVVDAKAREEKWAESIIAGGLVSVYPSVWYLAIGGRLSLMPSTDADHAGRKLCAGRGGRDPLSKVDCDRQSPPGVLCILVER